MGEHARLSPSAAKRWMTCPGSVALSEHFFDQTSEHAAEGTAAHIIREKCLRSGGDVSDFVGERVPVEDWVFTVTDEWVGWLQPGIDYLRELGGLLYVEHRVKLDAWMPGQFGTLDAGVVLPDLIVINDLKFGKGLMVDAVGNPQLMLYAAGFWEQVARHYTEAREFLLVVDQPRGRPDDVDTQWKVSLEDVLIFAEEAAAAARLVDQPDAPLQVSEEGCRFCLAAANAACPEMHRYCFDILEDMNVPIDQLTPERRSQIVKDAPIVRKWLNSVHGLHLDHAVKGLPTPGFKAVATLGDRQWVDDVAAEEFWLTRMPAKEIYNRKLKSPAQMEAIAGTRNWAKAQQLIARPEGNPALVPESDKRPALIPLLNLLDDIDDDVPAVQHEIDSLI